MMTRALPLLLLALATPALATPALGAPSIRVRPRAQIVGAVVHLGDVARLRGFTPATARRFAAIELGRAPASGVGQLLPKAYLRRKIRDGGVGPGVALHLPNRLELRRKTQILSGAELERQVRAAVTASMPYAPADVARLQVPRLSDVTVPVGTTMAVEFAPGEDFRGAVTATLRFEAAGERVRTRRLSLKVDAFTRAWGVRVATRQGVVLSAADLVALRLPVSKVPRDALLDPAEVEGARVRRAVKPGEALRRAWVKIPPMVRRGDRVRMVATRGPIHISAMGEALGAAARGENVRVRNLDSRRVVSGRVIAPNTVQMEF